MKWYVASMNNKHDQGLVCDEETGENICVVYDKKHASIIAGSPEMHELLCEAYNRFTDNDMIPPNSQLSDWLRRAEDVFAQIEKGE